MTWGLPEGEMNPALQSFAGFGLVCWEQEFTAILFQFVLQTLTCLLGAPSVAQTNIIWILLWKWVSVQQGWLFLIPGGLRPAGAALQEQVLNTLPGSLCMLCNSAELFSSAASLAAAASQTPLEEPGEAGTLLVLHTIDASYRTISVSRNSQSILKQVCSERCHDNWGQGTRRETGTLLRCWPFSTLSFSSKQTFLFSVMISQHIPLHSCLSLSISCAYIAFLDT